MTQKHSFIFYKADWEHYEFIKNNYSQNLARLFIESIVEFGLYKDFSKTLQFQNQLLLYQNNINKIS